MFSTGGVVFLFQPKQVFFNRFMFVGHSLVLFKKYIFFIFLSGTKVNFILQRKIWTTSIKNKQQKFSLKQIKTNSFYKEKKTKFNNANEKQ